MAAVGGASLGELAAAWATLGRGEKGAGEAAGGGCRGLAGVAGMPRPIPDDRAVNSAGSKMGSTIKAGGGRGSVFVGDGTMVLS